MRATKKQIGDYGEKIAERYLKKRGWHIISNNYRAHGGEIDIIGYRFGRLVCFEVKTRSNDKFGAPSDAVDGEKLSNILKARADFMQTYARDKRVKVFYPFGIEKRRNINQTRVDVIEVYLEDGAPTRINHIKDWENKL